MFSNLAGMQEEPGWYNQSYILNRILPQHVQALTIEAMRPNVSFTNRSACRLAFSSAFLIPSQPETMNEES